MNIINKGSTSNLNYAIDYLTDSSTLRFYALNSVGIMLFLIKSNNQLADFRWHHVAAVYNAADGKAVIYVDGDSVAGKIISTKPAILNDPDSLFIGTIGLTGQSDNKFIGQIDEIRIWKDIARTQAAINKDMFRTYSYSGGFIGHCEFNFNEYSNWMKASNSGVSPILDLKGNARFSSQLKQDNLYLSSPVLFRANDSVPEFGKSTKPWLIGKTGTFSDSFYISQPGNITDLKLYTLINTTLLANLKLELVGPTGVRVTVFPVSAFSWINGNDIMTIFDKAASNAIGETVLPPFSPRIIPGNSLDIFNGTPLNGWWKLVATHGGSVTTCWVNRWGIIPSWTAVSGISEKNNDFFKLYQNIPNPVNNFTVIKYSIPHKSDVKLTIFNELGGIISIPVNKELNPGTYEVEFNANNLPAGIYFYRMQADNYAEMKRMLIIK